MVVLMAFHMFIIPLDGSVVLDFPDSCYEVEIDGRWVWNEVWVECADGSAVVAGNGDLTCCNVVEFAYGLDNECNGVYS